MAENSNIGWTDHTFNPWIGCTKVSPGCAHCYAETLNHRWGKDNWGKGKPRRRTSESNWKQPLKWNREATKALFDWASDKPFAERDPNTKPRRPRVFCASMSDWLDDEVPIEWLADLLKLIHDTPNLDWQLLTKRPENWNGRMEMATLDHYARTGDYGVNKWLHDWRTGLRPAENVWIGTSVENQEYADKRIPELLKIPAKVRFISAEPLLGPVDIWSVSDRWQSEGWEVAGWTRENPFLFHWIISGGESGKGHRPMQIEWMRSLHDQCRVAGVAWFCKQDSGPKPGMRGRIQDDLWAQEFPNL